MEYDVAVVGGGSAGLLASREIAKCGYSVCVIEEHPEIGHPVQCSGLFSVSGLKALGIKLDDSLIANRIKGGRFYSPSGIEMEAYSDLERAYVVERKLFDKHLAKGAARSGAELMLKTKAKGIKVDSGFEISVASLGEDFKINSKLLVGADGLRSNVARWAGLSAPKKVVSAAQVEVSDCDAAQDIAEVYFGRAYAPNFYAWILPKGEVFEVGLGIRQGKMSPVRYLKKFLRRHPVASKKVRRKDILEFNMGGFPVTTVEKTVSDGLLIVGDAAGQVKATTGGGVIVGGIAAKLAGEACVNALEAGDFSKEFLKREYGDRWKEEIGTELKAHGILRQLMDSLSDEGLEELFKLAREQRIPEIMVKFEDTDRVSGFFKELLQNEAILDWIQRRIDLKLF